MRKRIVEMRRAKLSCTDLRRDFRDAGMGFTLVVSASYASIFGIVAGFPPIPPPFCITIAPLSPHRANMPDKTSEVLEEGLPVGVPKSFRAVADVPYLALSSILRAFQLLNLL